jgi:hypothetical protein
VNTIFNQEIAQRDFSNQTSMGQLMHSASTLLFSARVRRVIYLRQTLEIERSIDLRGGDGCVPQHFLYCAQIA